MSKICQITGKRPLSGNNVSHSNRRTKRRFLPNLQEKRFYIPEVKKWVTLKVTTKTVRTMNKLGIYEFLTRQLSKGFDPKVWVTDEKRYSDKKLKRGYRRVETVDANGVKSYHITYEPIASARKKVRLSTILKSEA